MKPRLRLRVRGRLFLASVSVVVAVIAVIGIFAQAELSRWFALRIEGELARKLGGARVAVERSASAPDDALADALGDALGARITIIDARGVVVGDSQVPTDQIAALENHAARPELKAALSGVHGEHKRWSSTVQSDMLYAAEPFVRADGRGAVRVAAHLTEINDAIARLRVLLGIAAALGLLVAVLMSALASHVFARALSVLVEHARALASGSAGATTLAADHAANDDEIGGLAGSLNRLALNLESTVKDLAAERDRSTALLEGMEDGVVALTPDGQTVLVNPAARTLLGVDGTIDVARVPLLDELSRRARAGEPCEGDVDATARNKKLLVRAAPIKGGGAVLVLHDVTDVRRMETVRRDFVANVSHELRTPVAVIRANSETLLSGALDDKERARQFLEGIERNAERLARLVSDLLDLSRIEAGQLKLELEDVDVRALCEHVLDGTAPRANKKQQQQVLAASPGLHVRADARALDQLLTNLVDNAVKYTPEGTRIVVRAKAIGAKVRIEVEDDGPGIEERHRPRIFERFYRVDSGRSRDAGGTGLGLAIVKHLAEALDGDVGLEPVTPRGSRFWVELPRST